MKKIIGWADQIDVIKDDADPSILWFDDNLSDHYPVVLRIMCMWGSDEFLSDEWTTCSGQVNDVFFPSTAVGQIQGKINDVS